MELLLEKEPLVEHLDKSKEYMETRIQKMETDIIRSIQNEWKDYLADLILKQKQRNRSIIKEIIKTCKQFRDSIELEFQTLKGEEDD